MDTGRYGSECSCFCLSRVLPPPTVPPRGRGFHAETNPAIHGLNATIEGFHIGLDDYNEIDWVSSIKTGIVKITHRLVVFSGQDKLWYPYLWREILV